jgi:hypothetical protein
LMRLPCGTTFRFLWCNMMLVEKVIQYILKANNQLDNKLFYLLEQHHVATINVVCEVHFNNDPIYDTKFEHCFIRYVLLSTGTWRKNC